MKAKIICILVMMLLTASVAIIPAKVNQKNSVNIEINKAIVSRLEASSSSLSIQSKSIGFSTNNIFQNSEVLGTNPAFDDPGDQTHPALLMNGEYVFLGACHDEYKANITVTWSTDYGQTWAPYVDTADDWDYPTGDYWGESRGGTRVIGTGLCNPDYGDGGWVLLYDVFDPTDPLNWTLYNYAFQNLGWYNQKDVELACDNSQNEWEWGVSSYVFSSTYEEGYIDGPTVVFADENTSGSAWINWWWVDGCAHTDVDIDPVTHQMYAVYDWYNTTSEMWELLIWTLDFTDPHNQDSWYLYEISGTGNLQYPVIAAYGDYLVILAQTDENGNSDIICYYSDNGMNDLQIAFVADSVDNELYPDLQHNFGQRFICTYVANNNLYASITEDGGANWADTRWQINENNGAVVEEYKTSDLCQKARMAVWEENHDDIDCYIGPVYNQAPEEPDINGPINGVVGVEYNYTFEATDPDGDDLYYWILWGDGCPAVEWIGPYASGEVVTLNHTFLSKGTFIISAQAKDVYDAEGPWGELEVTIPRDKTINNPFLNWLQGHPSFFPLLQKLLR